MNADTDLLQGLVAAQIGRWRGGAPARRAWEPAQRALWAARETVALYRIAAGGVDLVEKGLAEGGWFTQAYAARSALYLRLLRESAAARPVAAPISVAIDLADEAPENGEVPVFSFQKREGGANPLLPDPDLIALDYLEAAPADPVPFRDKADRATFSGSTTGGGLITREVLERGFPRLRAARAFRGAGEVEFRLTRIVQCASPEIAAALAAEGHGGQEIGWERTFGAKFGISIDGNGAACSRPAILLASRCVLMKYRSPHVLHYSGALRPGLDYVEVEEDGAIPAIVRAERANPGTYADVAESGRRFAARVLCRGASIAYTGALLAVYAELLGP